MAPDLFFLPVANGQRLCLYHAPAGKPKGVVLYVHPFAEEMNKSRRMAALQAKAMAEQGYGVLQIDLLGCGDSSGDFEDARWEAWCEDLVLGIGWLRSRVQAPLWLWGLRAGCLLAADVAKQLDESVNLLFWQPVTSGKQHLQQFLRLRVASQMSGGSGKGLIDSLRAGFAAGQSQEIAGYMLHPHLADSLDTADLRPPAKTGTLAWIELSPFEPATMGPASARGIDLWRDAGWSVRTAVLPGLYFWQATEIEEAPAMLAATIEALVS